MKRLNLGCGYQVAETWSNVDILDYGQEYKADVREGLPFSDDSFDYGVAHHSLQMLTYQEITGVLVEIRRVLKPEGVLRVSEPDFVKAVAAWQNGDKEWFPIVAEDSLDGKTLSYLMWYSEARLIFTASWMGELFKRAGWASTEVVEYGKTASRFSDITSLDTRKAESFFLEAYN